ncbi:pirin family protein [Limnohabitans sp.]|uniref:pirin family protein n=1 Tax=Limnohabitans sp. TaxID=1907725 RepID=UPI00286EBD0B|nr:pirin family protein [Limnohabitans sp.]
MSKIQEARSVELLVQGQDTQDGAGVRLTRVLSHDLQERLDPFLMLDAFGSDNPGDYIAGFPNHPHRGFETVTYMIAGRMRHKDSGGHEGLLQNGGVQWMTAGRGLTHSEMPEQEEGVMEGFQLWLNLPAKNKLCEPWYSDIQSEDIPEVTTANGVLVRVIAGHSHGTDGAIQREHTDPLYLDLHFPATADVIFEQPLQTTHNAFVYVYRGGLDVMQGGTSTTVPIKRMAVLTNSGEGLVLRAQANTRAIVIAGKPLNEPIAQYGPFVMNTREELVQAVDDFRAGLMG